MRYAFEDYVLDTTLFELAWRGVRRPLQPKPLDLLTLLVENRDRVVTKAELLGRLWPGVVVSNNALVQAVACTRDALREATSPPIANVRGKGYRFALPVVERASEAVPRPGAVVLDADDDGALAAALAPFVQMGTRVLRVVATAGLPAAPCLAAPCVIVIEHLERADATMLLLFSALARAKSSDVIVIGTCAFDALDDGARSVLLPLRVADPRSLGACA